MKYQRRLAPIAFVNTLEQDIHQNTQASQYNKNHGSLENERRDDKFDKRVHFGGWHKQEKMEALSAGQLAIRTKSEKM